ncbi:MAG TPA: alpha/beta hydrolase [Candidatus Acidoferrum sp.]|nr:alpha/beta hydrolase [Candidatus Acidoferrum sp.]
MKILGGIFCSVMLSGAALAAEPKVIPLWPAAAPGSESWDYPETDAIGPHDNVRRVSNVTHPTLTVYFPDSSAATRTAIIICPGGGFRWLSIDNEGGDVARRLNSFGVTAIVLKYRVVRTGDVDEGGTAKMAERRKTVIPLAIADGQQAIRVVRAHATEWGIAPDRIGIIGFSAGGYVTAAVALQFDAKSRPSFAAPIYPGTPEDVTPAADAPPLFLVHADDDKTVSPMENSIRLYAAWKKAGLPAEMHIYAQGGHGFGMRKRGLPVDSWIERFRDWLAALGLLEGAR